MFKIFRKGHYDVVHSHLDWYMNCYVCFLAMLAGVKKRIAHHHQAYSKWGLLCALFRIPCKLFATHWLACGEAAAINGWGKNAVKKGKVTILPNAIDPERFKFSEKSRQEIRAKYGIKEDDFVIGHVGRFFPEKNHKFIVRLFKRVLRQRTNCWLLLVGNGPLQQEIQKTVNELGLYNRVIFAGLQKDVVPFYCAMDALLLPSIREAFPMTLVEAQYNGLPCVVSDAVPRETSITNNVVFLSLTEVDLWTKYMEKSIMDVSCRENPSIANDKFEIENNIKKLRLIYENM